MADTSNLYQDLKNALNDFKTFLDSNVATLKPAITALEAVLPQVGQLLDQLITLMGQLKTAIQNLNVSGIPGLAQVSQFTTATKTLLQTAENLLPDQKSAIDSVLGVVDVVSGLPSLDQVKTDILNLIGGIIQDLNSLKA
jgi:ABC-type transporter Mla subunit MlaD